MHLTRLIILLIFDYGLILFDNLLKTQTYSIKKYILQKQFKPLIFQRQTGGSRNIKLEALAFLIALTLPSASSRLMDLIHAK